MNNYAVNSARKVVAHLMGAIKCFTLYPKAHPQIKIAVENLWRSLFSHLTNRPQMTLNFIGSGLYCEEDLLAEESISGDTFIALVKSKGVNQIKFMANLTQVEVHDFLALLVREDLGLTQTDFARLLAQAGVFNIKVQKTVKTGVNTAEKIRPKPKAFETALHHHKLAVSTLGAVFEQARLDHPIDVERIIPLVDWLIEGILGKDPAIPALTALHNHNEYLCHHSLNTAIHSLNLGSLLGLKSEELRSLGHAAILHDIGKVNIPPTIFSKPGKLTSQEWQAVNRHPIDGAQILAGLPLIDSLALIVAYEHHIGYDLSGYPLDDQTPMPHLFSRITKIADTFDGLTSDRAYHGAHQPTSALTIMTGTNAQAFDPVLLRLFVKALGVYPVGSLVLLNDDRHALVIAADSIRPDRPVVKIISESQTMKLREAENVSIKEILDPGLFDLDIAEELQLK